MCEIKAQWLINLKLAFLTNVDFRQRWRRILEVNKPVSFYLESCFIITTITFIRDALSHSQIPKKAAHTRQTIHSELIGIKHDKKGWILRACSGISLSIDRCRFLSCSRISPINSSLYFSLQCSKLSLGLCQRRWRHYLILLHPPPTSTPTPPTKKNKHICSVLASFHAFLNNFEENQLDFAWCQHYRVKNCP